MIRAMLGVCIIFALCTRFSKAQGQADCGARCLYVAVCSLDKDAEVKFKQLSDQLPVATDGVSLNQLQEQARAMGFQTLAVQTSLSSLNHRQRPFACIAYLKRKHFVLITSSENGIVVVSDPPDVHRLPIGTFLNEWDGQALLLAKSPIRPEEEIVSELWWRNTLRRSLVCIGPMVAIAAALAWWRRSRKGEEG